MSTEIARVFVKVSGDLLIPETEIFTHTLEWIQTLVNLQNHHVVICVGGGTQINEALKTAGFHVGIHGPLGRELKTEQERKIAEQELAHSMRLLLKNIVPGQSLHSVIVPVLNLGGVPCHVNGDTMVTTAYLGFNVLYILTQSDRVEKKTHQFAHLRPKVRVIGF